MQEVESPPASRRVKAMFLSFIICMFLNFVIINIGEASDVFFEGPEPLHIFIDVVFIMVRRTVSSI